jgi:hypothetical protein
MSIKSFSALLFSLLFILASCGGNEATATQDAETVAPHGEGKEYTSAYVCPMHCTDSGSDAEGTCAACGMAYVTNETHTANGHKH